MHRSDIPHSFPNLPLIITVPQTVPVYFLKLHLYAVTYCPPVLGGIATISQCHRHFYLEALNESLGLLFLFITLTRITRMIRITPSYGGACHLDRMGEISRRWCSIEMTKNAIFYLRRPTCLPKTA